MIHCDNLVKIYKSADLEVVALQGLNLDIESGELMAIIGNSGSGKSTLLNMLGGLDRPSAGKLIVGGKDLLKFNERDLVKYKRESVGFVWQNNARNLIPYLTALENVELPSLLQGNRKKERGWTNCTGKGGKSMKQTFKRIIAVMIVLCTLLAGCSSDKGAQKQTRYTGEITFLTFKQYNENSFNSLPEKAATLFEEQNPGLNVIIERVEYDEYHAEIKRRYEEEKLPDLFLVWGGEMLNYEQKGYLADVSDFLRRDDLRMEDYFANKFIEASSSNGKPVAIPFSLDIAEVVYRKSWFDKAELPYPNPDWTWNDFVAASKQLADAHPGKGGAIIPYDLTIYESFIVANGGSILSPDGKTAQGYFDGDASVEAFQTVFNSFGEGAFSPYTGYESAYDAFKNGLAGMGILSLGYLGTDLKMPADDLGFITLPVMNSGKPTAQLLNFTTMGISSQSANPEAAWGFVKYLFMDNNEISQEAYQEGLSVSKKVAETAKFDNPYIKEMFRAMEYTLLDKTAFIVNKDFFPAYYLGRLWSNFDSFRLADNDDYFKRLISDLAKIIDNKLLDYSLE